MLVPKKKDAVVADVCFEFSFLDEKNLEEYTRKVKAPITKIVFDMEYKDKILKLYSEKYDLPLDKLSLGPIERVVEFSP